MKRLALTITTAILLTLFLLPAGKSHAITVLYEATDLTDMTSGQDLWEYVYTVSGYSFDMDYGFTIWFDYTLYSDLQDPPPLVNDDWDPIVLQPEPPPPLGLGDDGAYDALALQNGASLADPFTVSFVWLGAGTPGPQPFDVYHYDWESGTANILESGETAPVPEPATVLLVGSGLAGMAVLRKRKNKSRT